MKRINGLGLQAVSPRFFTTRTSNTLIVVNSDYGLYTAIQEAKSAGWNTVAIHPAYSTSDGGADLALPVDNIMSVPDVLRAIEYAQVHFPRTKAYVHPVYGYHSELTGLNQAVSSRKHLKMVAPPAKLVHQCGDKREARKLACSLGIPVIPGYHDDDVRLSTLLKEWKKLGHKPAMLKTTDGGGGKGNRIIRTEEELSHALSELGGNVILETLLSGRFKQIEAQLVITQNGPLYLPPRDCSEQWRFQKKGREIGFQPQVLAGLLPGFEKITAYQKKFGDYLFTQGYEGPGTAEFLVDLETGDVFFVEINTRLQVENQASGIPAGLNILSLQRLIAAGESIDNYVDSLLAAKKIQASRSSSLDTKLQLLMTASPKVCVQLRIYGYETRVEQNGHHRMLVNYPCKGTVDTLDLPRSRHGYVDSYLKPGLLIDTSLVDGMLGIVYGYGDNLATATKAAHELVSRTHLSLPTNQPTTKAWLSAVAKKDYHNIHTGSLESYLARSLWSHPSRFESHSEGHYDEHAASCFSRY